MRARAGRLPTDVELDRGERVVVVSETVARQYWPSRAAVGQTLDGRLGSFEVIGTVRDARFRALDLEPTGEIYLSINAYGVGRYLNVLVEAENETAPALTAVSNYVRGSERNWRLRRIGTGTEILAGSISSRRLNGLLFGVFGAAALTIVATGVFGFVGMSAAKRNREIGIRLAVGGTAFQVTRRLTLEQLRPAVIGMAVGLASAVWTSQLINSMLYGVGPFGLGAWMIGIAAILLCTIAGTLLPLARAVRRVPVDALRDA